MSVASHPVDQAATHTSVQRKRVLLLTHRFPYPPNRGDRIRSYNLLRVLATEFDVTLACPHDEPIEDSEREHVRGLCESVITEPLNRSRWLRAGTSVIRGGSLTEGLFRIPSLQQQINQAQQDRPFDAAFAFCSSMFPYLRSKLFQKTPTIVDVVDVDSEKWRQMGAEKKGPKGWVYRIESERVKRLEIEIGRSVDSVTLVSDSEATLFNRVADPVRPALGVSNGVDTEYFDRGEKPLPDGTPIRLVFTGVMDYPPNVEGMCWFCENVLPVISRSHNVQLKIVGRNPSRRVLELGNLPGVEVTGPVPDVRPHLHDAAIAVSPLHLARGIQNKVLEAMAAGLPVIATPQSATGIDGTPGKHFLIAETVDDWCEALTELSADANYRNRVGVSAREFVVERYAWNARTGVRKRDAREPDKQLAASVKSCLVTGGAGFIGSCFVRRTLADRDSKVVNLDALTYAGNRDSVPPAPSTTSSSEVTLRTARSSRGCYVSTALTRLSTSPLKHTWTDRLTAQVHSCGPM